MKTRRIAAAVLFALLPLAVSPPAAAQDDPSTVQARARFKEGVDAYDKGKYEEARLSFLQAYTLKKHPSVLLNLAQSSAKSNHPLEAAKYFQQFLKEATNATPQQRKDAEAGLAEVRQRLGRIDVVAPAGTEISLDDQGRVGTTPFDPIDVEIGQHTVKSPTQSVTVIAVGGQKVEAKLGQTASSAPVAPVPAATSPSESSSNVSNGDSVVVSPDEDKGTKHSNLFSAPKNMAPVYVGLVVAGVGLAGAVVFAAFKADAQSKADTVASDIRGAAIERRISTVGACHNASAPELGPACKTLTNNNDKVDTNALIANVSLGVMGAGLLFTAAYYLAATKNDDAAPPQAARAPQRPVLTPYAGWGNGGLSLSGEF
jgi:hypothetical protein